MAALDADLFEAGGVVGGAAGEVVSEHAAGEFVEPVAFGLGAEFEEQASAEAEPACLGVDVDRVLADAFIDATVGVRAGSGPPHDPAGMFGDDERPVVDEPGCEVVGGPRVGLEGGDALGDSRVVGGGDAIEVMRELGIDLSDRKPEPLTRELAEQPNVVVTMGCGDQCPSIPGKRYIDWELPTPTANRSRSSETSATRSPNVRDSSQSSSEPPRVAS